MFDDEKGESLFFEILFYISIIWLVCEFLGSK